jgi:PAS domain S-box-containing protein
MDPGTTDQPINILVVDDKPENVLAIEAALSGPNYKIIGAHSGQEALTLALSTEFAVVLLDVQMPVMNGFDTARVFREIDKTRSIPIIFVTANHPSEDAALRSYRAGGVDCLFKPLNVEILRTKVEVFAELFKSKLEIKRQAKLLRDAELRQRDYQLAEFRRFSERKYQELIDNIPNSIVFALDPESMRLLYSSRRVEEITGFEVDAFFKSNELWVSRVHPDDRVKYSEDFARAVETGKGELDYRFIRADGRVIWLNAWIRTALDESFKKEMRGLTIDVTRLKEIEAALRESVKIRDRFLSVAAHELKTPITPLQLQMQGFQRVLKKGVIHKIPAEKLELMVEISNSQVNRLGRLINELLDLTRLDEGRLRLNLSHTDLCLIIRSTVSHFEQETEEDGTSPFILKLPPSLEGNWDSQKLEQVITNLVSNAVKYGMGRPIEISAKREDHVVKLSIRDQGIGIDPKDQMRIFERFERAVSEMHYGGLGLGLYITREIITLHGGKISVASTPDKGSTFEAELPV